LPLLRGLRPFTRRQVDASREAPIQLLLDAVPGFDHALFIENLVTFERMADQRQPAWQRSLLVYAAGFKGSARRLRSRDGCRLYLRESGAPATALQPVVDWLFGPSELPVSFFGDLDYAGMQILCSLRSVFPAATAWLPGYARLADLLAARGGHAPEQAAKELQTDPGRTGCELADARLLPLMRQHGRFVDQEAFGAGTAQLPNESYPRLPAPHVPCSSGGERAASQRRERS
jgi:hypothetical protein